MDINQVMLIGRLTKDPELRYTQSSKAVCNFTLAVGRDADHTNFIQCVAWNKTAEAISNYCHKGKQLGVLGSIYASHYDNEQGQRVYKTEVICSKVQFLGTSTNSDEGIQTPEKDNDSKDWLGTDKGFNSFDINDDDIQF